MADLAALREWADTAFDQLPPEHEAFRRADTTLILIHWSLDAVDVIRAVLPLIHETEPEHGMLTELLVRWNRDVG